mgnify:CR=1 FL=1
MGDESAHIASLIVAAQDDPDTVLLPNACKSQLIELDDGDKVRCFSVLVREPHVVPPQSWCMISTPESLTPVDGIEVVADKLMVDHVTRGIIGDSAMQVHVGRTGDVESIRLLPSHEGSAQDYWAEQARLRLDI